MHIDTYIFPNTRPWTNSYSHKWRQNYRLLQPQIKQKFDENINKIRKAKKRKHDIQDSNPPVNVESGNYVINANEFPQKKV